VSSENEIYHEIQTGGPKTPPEIADTLDISKAQARTSLNRLVKKNSLIKIGKRGRAVLYGLPETAPETETEMTDRNETTETKQPKPKQPKPKQPSIRSRIGDPEFARVLTQQIPRAKKDLLDHIRNRGVGDEYLSSDLDTIRRRFGDLLENLNWILDNCADSKPVVIRAFQTLGIVPPPLPKKTPKNGKHPFSTREYALLKNDIAYLQKQRRIDGTTGNQTITRERFALYKKIKKLMKISLEGSK